MVGIHEHRASVHHRQILLSQHFSPNLALAASRHLAHGDLPRGHIYDHGKNVPSNLQGCFRSSETKTLQISNNVLD